MTLDPSNEQHAHALERLGAEKIAWLTSVTPDGEPQTMPVWFLWEDGTALIYSAKDAVRNRNVATNPRVTLHLSDDGVGGDLVVIAGEARVDEAAPSADRHAPYLAKYGGMIAGYGWTNGQFARDYPLPLRITPTRIRVAG